jgi:nucleoid DNA-binding protein
MTKKELVDSVAVAAGITRDQADAAVVAVFNTVKGLAVGDKFVVHRFGTFRKVVRKEKLGRNPQTGAALTVPAKAVLRFKESDSK